MKGKSIKNKIKEYFFLYPTNKLRVREVEREVKVPLPSAIRYCKELEEENILKTEIIGNVKFYTAKRDKQFFNEKMLFNIKQIQNSEIIEHIKEKLSNPPIILFGSYSKGEDTEKSDIDLYIETKSKNKLQLKKYELILKRDIQVFKDKLDTNPHLGNNIINGITLNNHIEVFK